MLAVEGRGGQLSYAAVFAPALLDPDRATPAAVAGPNGKSAKTRYGVYRNNVTASLINALAAVFLVLWALRRSARRAAVPLIPIALATGWAALILFVLRVPLNPMSAALGAVAGFPAGRLVASHFAVMTRHTAQVLIGGPALVERALGVAAFP